MTVVIGYVNKKTKEVIMGADRCVSSNLERYTFSCSKIYQPYENPNFLIGIAGDPRVHQLIKAFLVLPREEELAMNNLIIDDNYIVRYIIPKIGGILIEQNYPDPELNQSSIMIAYKDKVWKIGNGFQLISFEDDFLTIGSGQFAARGVLSTLEDIKMSPMNKVIKALTLSTKMAVGVEGPYDIFVTGRGKLNDKQLIDMIENPIKPEILNSQEFNYIKKVIKENVNLLDEVEEYDDILYFTNDNKNIFFVDLNGILVKLKPNGDIILNTDDIEELEDKIWNIVELNGKAKSILNKFSDKIKLELTDEEIDTIANEPLEIDSIIEDLIKKREIIIKEKEEYIKRKKHKEEIKKVIEEEVPVKEIEEEVPIKEIEEIRKPRRKRNKSNKKENN